MDRQFASGFAVQSDTVECAVPFDQAVIGIGIRKQTDNKTVGTAYLKIECRDLSAERSRPDSCKRFFGKGILLLRRD